MQNILRRTGIGLLAGLVSSVTLVLTFGNPVLAMLTGGLVGLAYALMFPPARNAYADNIMTAAALGPPLWALVNVIALPLLAGQPPQWSGDGMRVQFPSLIGWVLFGGTLGFLNQLFNELAVRVLGEVPQASHTARNIKTNIVILGGGFAGMTTTDHLEHTFGADPSVEITLVSETNALLFTPMLAEVAASSLEPTHISTPLRTSLRRTRWCVPKPRI